MTDSNADIRRQKTQRLPMEHLQGDISYVATRYTKEGSSYRRGYARGFSTLEEAKKYASEQHEESNLRHDWGVYRKADGATLLVYFGGLLAIHDKEAA